MPLFLKILSGMANSVSPRVCTICLCHFVRNFGVWNFRTFTVNHILQKRAYPKHSSCFNKMSVLGMHVFVVLYCQVKKTWYAWYFFGHLLQGREFLWLPVCISAHQTPSESSLLYAERICSQRKLFFYSRSISDGERSNMTELSPLKEFSIPLSFGFW